MKLRRYFIIINVLIGVVIAGLFWFGGALVFALAYAAVFVIVLVRNLLINGDVRVKVGLCFVFVFILIVQIAFSRSGVFPETAAYTDPAFWLLKLTSVALLVVPMVISRYVSVGKYAAYYLPSVREARTISIAEFRHSSERIRSAATDAKNAANRLSPDNFKEIMEDLHRFDQFNYVNDGSLTDAYFQEAASALSDERIYIVISNTGSPASEIISVFTNKQFNHASLSFDRDLKTLISYNGGDRVYPPGLNPEMLTFFNRKEDAGILVYSLPCPGGKKKILLDKVCEINNEGSAYNMLGLVSGASFRPNIMFCSQFVYRMLELAGLAYFNKAGGKVEPTDFVELDYRRALEFEYEIRFNQV